MHAFLNQAIKDQEVRNMWGCLCRVREEISLDLAPGPLENLLKALRASAGKWYGPLRQTTGRGLVLDVMEREVG